MSKDTKIKAAFNPDCTCYFSSDGKYLCYRTLDIDTKRPVTLTFEVGKDGLTEELTVVIDKLNHEEALGNRYYNEAKDRLFEYKQQRYFDADNDAPDPWGQISSTTNGIEDTALEEDTPENPKVDVVRDVIEKCTLAQKWLFFEHFAMGRTMDDLRYEEMARTGKKISRPAFSARLNKILDKVAKALGTTRVNRRKYKR